MDRIRNSFVEVNRFVASNPRVIGMAFALIVTAMAAIFGIADAQMVAWGPATGGTGGV